MENQNTLSEKESLELIGKMIHTVKNDINDNSFYYLLWGWLVFIASMGHWIWQYFTLPMPYLTWIVLMPLGGIISIYYGFKFERKQKVRTYIDDIMKFVLIAFLVSLFMVLLFMPKLTIYTYPMVMMVYAIWLFISGGALRFKPLIYGGIVNWILAIGAMYVGFQTQLLLLALAVLLGYIIPGHMLKSRYNAHQRSVSSAS